MGLDSIELLVEVEKAFGISIPDQEAERIITVGDFHNSVWQHLEGKHSDTCHSQSLFYQLRQSFVDLFKFSRQEINLNTSMNEIFPNANRRQIYLSFANANKFTLPDLVLPKQWAAFLNTFGLITILGGLILSIVLINFFDSTKWTLLFPVIGIILTYFASEMLKPKRTVIHPSLIRDFTQKVLSLNYATLINEKGTNRKEVESVINHIIADKVGVDIDEVTADKKICDDLGVD
jgi:acyl carrier protein